MNNDIINTLARETLDGDGDSYVVLKDILEQNGDLRLIKRSKKGKKDA